METVTVGGDDMTDWPQIIATYGGLVWKTARSLLNNDADAADCFQETFVETLNLNVGSSMIRLPSATRRRSNVRNKPHEYSVKADP